MIKMKIKIRKRIKSRRKIKSRMQRYGALAQDQSYTYSFS